MAMELGGQLGGWGQRLLVELLGKELLNVMELVGQSQIEMIVELLGGWN